MLGKEGAAKEGVDGRALADTRRAGDEDTQLAATAIAPAAAGAVTAAAATAAAARASPASTGSSAAAAGSAPRGGRVTIRLCRRRAGGGEGRGERCNVVVARPHLVHLVSRRPQRRQ